MLHFQVTFKFYEVHQQQGMAPPAATPGACLQAAPGNDRGVAKRRLFVAATDPSKSGTVH
jgi:hypothetical protein